MIIGSASSWLRATVVLALVGVLALPVDWSAGAEPGPTQVINVVAVDARGTPVNGYHVVNRQASPNLSGCWGPSPAAVGTDIYTCQPSQAAAEVCWPANATVLCLIEPWSKALRRFRAPLSLPTVDPPPSPIPFALVLDDGTRCILPNGIALGGRADGSVPIYGCGGTKLSHGVLAPPDWDPALAIDRSRPAWAVYVGQLGPPTTPFEPPRRHTIRTAWFAASA